MTAKLTSLSYLGMAVETTLGTPVAATGFIPIRSFKPQDDPKYIADTGYRGQPVDTFGEYLSVTSGKYDIDGDAYPTSFGNVLGMIFGVDTVSGTSSPYTHAFTGIATTPSWTFNDYYVAGFRQWPGLKATKLTIKFTPDAGLTYTLSCIGYPSATGTAPTSETYGTNPYFLGWEAALTIAGTSNTKLNSFTLDIQRKGSKPLFSAQDSQNPFDIFSGPISADWDLDFYMEDDSEYTLALSQAVQAVAVTITQPGTNYAVTFTSTAVQFTKPTIDRSKDFVGVALTGTAIYNSTDSGLVTASLTNATQTAYTTTAAS